MTFRQRTNSWLSRLAAAILITFLSGADAHSENVVESALGFFAGKDCNTTSFDLDRSRPQPVSLAFKAGVLRSLPKESRIAKLSGAERQKIDSVGIVLDLHQRQFVYDFIIFKSSPMPFAFLGLHQRAVVLISDIALELLDAAELQASVAHEIGHEYIWTEYLDAEKRNDERGLKRLELICDGIAVLTLRRAGLSPAPLLTAAQKITNYNRLTGLPANAYRYPSAGERKKFVQALCDCVDPPTKIRR